VFAAACIELNPGVGRIAVLQADTSGVGRARSAGSAIKGEGHWPIIGNSSRIG